MGFKENLKSELAFQDMLVKELSEKTGVSRRTLDNYLRENPATPTAENAVKIAQALGVSVEYLVTGKQAPDSVAQSTTKTDLNLIIRHSRDLPPNEQRIVLDVINSLRNNLHSPL